MYYDDEIERKPTRFGDAIIGDPDNGQYSKQSICTGKQRVSAFPKKTNNEKTKNRSKDSEDIKKENIASGNNTCCLSDSLGDFVNDARQIRIVIEAFDNEEFVKEPPNNIVKLTDDFNPFMVSAAEGHSKTILDQRKKEVINLLAKDNLLTPEIKEKILACTAVYDVNEIYEQTVIQPVEEERDISEQTKRHVQRYMENLRNGNFDGEFNRSRKAEIGPGNPPDLSKEGILEARDEFGIAIENMDEILFGGQSENTSGTSRTRKNSNKENNK